MHDTSTRLAIYMRMLFDGGIERVMINLCHDFVERGLKVDLVLNSVADGCKMLAQFPSEVRIVDLEAPRLSKSLPDVMRYLQRERPAALLAAGHYASEMAIVAKHLSRVPTRIVVSEHSNISKEAKGARKNELKRWIPIAARLTYPWSDGIVAVSQGVAQDLAQACGIPLQRLQVIYNPVFTPNLRCKADEPVDHPWFAPGQPPVILGVGRLEPQKDFETLVRAFAHVRQERPARLVILGQGGDEQKLKTLASELGVEEDVALLGFAENPYAYMSRSAVFALSSAWEGLPTVLIEAMAIGTPVVSTNCKSGPAEILRNGEYGTLVPVRDSKAMATAILEALSSDRKQVDSGWLNQFTLKAATEQYLKLLGL